MVKKILLAIGILLVLIIGAAIILPIVYKDKIVAMVKEEVNKNVNAKVDFGDFDLSLIKHFPDFTLSIQKLSVVGINEFAGDTLTSMKELGLTVNVMSVIKGDKIEIVSVRLIEPYVNLFVLKDGKANWDIAKADSSASKSSEPSKFNVSLKSYSIEKGYISYDDAVSGMKTTLKNLDHTGKGDFTQDLFVLRTNTSIEETNLWSGGVKYMHNIRAKLKADLDMDMINSKYTFKENELELNELVLGFDGWLAMPGNDIAMDIKFDAKKNEFRNFMSLIPGVYRDGFKDVKTSGSLAFKGFVKGTYNEKRMPGFGINLNVQNGKFQYPSLPLPINNVQIDLAVANADGIPDHTNIDLNKMHVDLGTEPFDAKLRVRTPVSDAQIDGMIKGKVNFANLGKIIPLEAGTTISGLMVSDLSFNGRMSAIEQKRYEDFKAAGSISLSNFNYSSKDYKQGFQLFQCALTFNPQNVTLNSFVAKMGTSDFNANGSLDNLLAYMFKKETLKGTLNLRSMNINLADFTSEKTTATTADTTPLTLIEVPANLDFVLNTTIGKLTYDNVRLDNMSGKVTIRNQAINMENLSFNTLGGSMKLSGLYATREHKKADMALNMDISGFDIQQTVKTFNSVKKMAPIAERANGKFNTSMTLNGKLDEHMQPIYPTLNGGGKLSTMNVVISQFPPLVKLADALKMDQFKSLPISNTNISFKFVSGRINIDPFDVTMAGIPANVKGSTGFDQTIDYNIGMNVPNDKIPAQASGVIKGLIATANSKGANFSMGATTKVDAIIGGTVSNPTVKTAIAGTSGNVVKDLKDKAKEELDKKKQELEQKGKEEADRLKKEAEAKAKAEVEKAKAKAKKEAEDKAKNAIKGIFKK